MTETSYLSRLAQPVTAAKADHLDAFVEQSLGYVALRCGMAAAITAVMIFSGMVTTGVIWGLLVASAEFLWTSRSRVVLARRHPLMQVEYLTMVFINLVLVVTYLVLSVFMAVEQTSLMTLAAVTWVAGGFFAAILVLVPDRLLMATTYGPAVASMILVANLVEWNWNDAGGSPDSALTLAISCFFAIFVVRAFMMAIDFQRRAYNDKQALELRREMVERASVNKTAFLARMSHEIRTPLNGVLGCANLLAETGLTDRQRRLSTQIMQSGDTLLSVLNDLLDISKIELGGLELETGAIELRKLFDESIALVSEDAAKAGVVINCHLDQRLPEQIIGDAPRFRQIILNLLTNAVRFNTTGDLNFGLWHEGITPNGQVLLGMEIFETGATRPALLRHAPEPVFGSSRGHRFDFEQSASLGLVIARDLAEQMGGEMLQEEVPDRGFRLSLRVPVAGVTDSPPIGAAWRAQLDRTRVMIFDPRGYTCERTIASLKAAGLDASCAQSIDRIEAQPDLEKPVDFIWVAHGSHGETLFAELATLRRHPSCADSLVVFDHVEAPASGEGVFNPPVRNGAAADAVFDAVVKRGQSPRSLPSILCELLQQKAAGTLPKQLGGEIPDLTGHRIVLAEDDATNQLLLKALLEPTGADIAIAADGVEAVSLVGRKPTDLILMDIRMPRMDGLEAARQIRSANGADGSLRIIAVTAGVRNEDRQSFLAAGMDDYLAKPLIVDDVYDLLRHHLIDREDARHANLQRS